MQRADLRRGEPGAADDDGEGPNFRLLAVRVFFFNMLVLAAAFTLYWYWIANAIELEILMWIKHQRDAGQTVDFSSYSRGGWPMAVTLTFRDLHYAPGAGSGWSYRVDALTLRHPLDDDVAAGLERMRDVDPQRAAELSQWLDQAGADFRILTATGEIYRLWGRLMDTFQPHMATDALIAAIALHHGLTVATRNTKAVLPFGVLVTNPWRSTR